MNLLSGYKTYIVAAIMLLIGLAAKNAILIVEFAKMKFEEGMSAPEAALEAAKLRFRPILMTSFAFILGCVPLILASGSGAASRVALGTTVVFGMSVATLLGVFLVPFLFTMVQRISGARPGAPDAAAAPPAAAGEAAQAERNA